MRSLFFITITLLLISCSTFPNNESSTSLTTTKNDEYNSQIEQAFQNSIIVMRFDDIPGSYWKKRTGNQTMFFNLFINDTTKFLNDKVIKKLSISDTYGRTWEITPEYDGFRIGEWGNFYTTDLSVDGSVVSLEQYKLVLITMGDKTYTRTINPSINMNSGTKKYIYSCSYKGKLTNEYLNSLARPVIHSSKVANNQIEIDFSVTDYRVKNTCIIFFNKNNDSIASTTRLYNAFSEQIHPILNNGEYFNTEGKINHALISESDIDINEGFTFRDIKYVRIYVYYTKKDKYFIATISDPYEINWNVEE
jgi:hypothetical protein